MIRLQLKAFINKLYFVAILACCSCFNRNTVSQQNLKPIGQQNLESNNKKPWDFKDTILQNQKMRKWIIDSALTFKDSLMAWNPDLKILSEDVDPDSSGYSFITKLSNNVNDTNDLKLRDAILTNLMEILKFNEIKFAPPFTVDVNCVISIYVESNDVYVSYVYDKVLVDVDKYNKKYDISIVKTNVTNVDTL